MRTPSKVVSGMISRTLINRWSSFIHDPEVNCCATTERVARSLSFSAASSVRGTSPSPTKTVSRANSPPTKASICATRHSDTPEARITVYSEAEASWLMATRVPISTASGISS